MTVFEKILYDNGGNWPWRYNVSIEEILQALTELKETYGEEYEKVFQNLGTNRDGEMSMDIKPMTAEELKAFLLKNSNPNNSV